jgi:hypothetical protein
VLSTSSIIITIIIIIIIIILHNLILQTTLLQGTISTSGMYGHNYLSSHVTCQAYTTPFQTVGKQLFWLAGHIISSGKLDRPHNFNNAKL